jgi:heat shock protein HtpX
MITRFAYYSGLFGGFGGNRDDEDNGAPALIVIMLVSMVVYVVSFLLTRTLSRYRELSADRAGAYLTMRPQALASALQKISGEMAAIPQKDLRATQAMNAFFIAPAVSGATLKTLTATHPSLEQRLEQLARIQAELARPQQ